MYTCYIISESLEAVYYIHVILLVRALRLFITHMLLMRALRLFTIYMLYY